MKKYRLYNRDLKKEYWARYDYIKIHKLDIDLKATNIVIEADDDVDLEQRIVYFVNKMKEISKEEDLKLLIHNLTTITINKSKFNFNKLKNIYGFYDPEKNTINVYDSDYKKTLNHESSHMSSSYYDKENEIIYSGFSQSKDNKVIGMGINEGYTQYLTEKYFDNEGSINEAYVYEKTIASIIAQTIGDEKMLSLYLNANLYGLLEELAKYTSMHDAYMFVMNMDFISNNMSNKNILSTSREYMIKVFKEINLFMLKLTAGKYYEIKDLEKQYKYLEKILNDFPDKVIVNRHLYNITEEADAINVFKDAHAKKKEKVKVKSKQDI